MEHLDESEDLPLVEPGPRDADAFALIYRRHVKGIRSFTLRRCGDPHLADDVTAIVFERAWRHFPTLRVPEYGVGPWLYRIAANELASHFRRRGRGERANQRLALVRVRDEPDPAERMELQHDVRIVRAALGRLRTRHQEVISLRYLAGLTPQETAEAMGTTPSVVAAVLHRALKALERAIDEAHPPGEGEAPRRTRTRRTRRTEPPEGGDGNATR